MNLQLKAVCEIASALNMPEVLERFEKAVEGDKGVRNGRTDIQGLSNKLAYGRAVYTLGSLFPVLWSK